MSNNFVYLTREKLVELEAQLKDMKTNGRSEAARKIAEARSHGDLSENSEYDAAKEEMQMLELRIAQLEQTLTRTRVMDPAEVRTDKVYIFSRVHLLDMLANKKIEYQLVSTEEADLLKGKISTDSPIGKSLLGKVVGDVVSVKVPAGMKQYRILEIGR
ncbi:MAG: transcription elongation factor GreA [Bacteroidetes bacterium]|jgi:transcription elongation factor GreA|nr:transcription elongation factor GreA [Bacteroidota bacterium]MCL5268034.1 transcription elongation factor GreA [Bacteroidota bacterium]